MARAKADKVETAEHTIKSKLAAPTEQHPKTHDEKVAAVEERRAWMQKVDAR